MNKDENFIVTKWSNRIKSHPIASAVLLSIIIITTTASLFGVIGDFRSWVFGDNIKPYEALVFGTSDGIGVTKGIYERIEESKPGKIFYISVEAPNFGGPDCAGETDCEIWELHLRKCNFLREGPPESVENESYWTPEREEIFGLDPQCIPALLLPTKMETGKSNVMNCYPNGYILSGFFTVHYLRGHFGQLFYRAFGATINPDRVAATLSKYGSNSCWE